MPAAALQRPPALQADRGSQSMSNSTTFHIHDPYVWKFWRPYLGAIPFDLWQILYMYQGPDGGLNSDWPSISHLSDILAIGDRYTILGRASYKSAGARKGAIDILAENHVGTYWIDGKGTQKRYSFVVEDRVPLLTPEQAKGLPVSLQQYHYEFVFAQLGPIAATHYQPPVHSYVPASVREAVFERDKNTCRYCGAPATEIDHVIPSSRGGRHVKGNLVAACTTCNLKKGSKTPEEAGMEIIPLEELP